MVVSDSARVFWSVQLSAEAKAEVRAPTLVSTSAGPRPSIESTFQPACTCSGPRARLISSTRSAMSPRQGRMRSRASPWGSRYMPPRPLRTRATNWTTASSVLWVGMNDLPARYRCEGESTAMQRTGTDGTGRTSTT